MNLTLKNEKREFLSTGQMVLTLIYVVCLMLSNIISSRIFNFFGFSMTSAVMLFPITYILSDVFSEVYGYKWSRRTCYLAFFFNFFATAVFFVVSVLPTFDWSVKDALAFNTVLRGSMACTFASFIAFVIGDFANDKVFSVMKKKHPDLLDHKGFGVRALLSSLVGEFFDSIIYLPLAFLVFNPIMTVKDCLIMVVLQVFLKTGYEAIILPVTIFVTKKLSTYEFNYRKVAVTG